MMTKEKEKKKKKKKKEPVIAAVEALEASIDPLNPLVTAETTPPQAPEPPEQTPDIPESVLEPISPVNSLRAARLARQEADRKKLEDASKAKATAASGKVSDVVEGEVACRNGTIKKLEVAKEPRVAPKEEQTSTDRSIAAAIKEEPAIKGNLNLSAIEKAAEARQ